MILKFRPFDNGTEEVWMEVDTETLEMDRVVKKAGKETRERVLRRAEKKDGMAAV